MPNRMLEAAIFKLAEYDLEVAQWIKLSIGLKKQLPKENGEKEMANSEAIKVQ